MQALLNDPKILILDEPTAGLDPKERIRIRNLISDLSQDRIVLIATHVVSDIEFISKEILLMKNGRLIDKASPEQLQAKIQGKVFEMSVGQQELEEVKEKFEISNLFRKDGQNYRSRSDTEASGKGMMRSGKPLRHWRTFTCMNLR